MLDNYLLNKWRNIFKEWYCFQTERRPGRWSKVSEIPSKDKIQVLLPRDANICYIIIFFSPPELKILLLHWLLKFKFKWSDSVTNCMCMQIYLSLVCFSSENLWCEKILMQVEFCSWNNKTAAFVYFFCSLFSFFLLVLKIR